MSSTSRAMHQTTQTKLDTYVEWVSKRCTEPGARAALRRGLRRSPDQAVTMHRYVAPWTDADRHDEWAYYTVAALIAAQPPATRNAGRADPPSDAETTARPPQDSPIGESGRQTAANRRWNLGATLAGFGGDSDRVDSIERRLHLLVRQETSGIQRHLPGVIRQLASARITPDWGLLLRDLTRWHKYRAQVSREWLQDYYRVRFREDKNSQHTDSVPTDDSTGE
jgi:CRISPR system Cascade subunit CasB